MRVTSMEQKPTASEAVIEAVARRNGLDPLELKTPLYDAIDSDRLDTLVESARQRGNSTVEVTFEYSGYTVTVNGDGAVTLRE